MYNSTPTEVSRERIAKWINTAKPVSEKPTWTERRLVIDFGGHTYVVNNGQVFQCAHCGHYDPEWTTVEVLTYFKNTFGIVPREIEITCTVL